MVCARLHIICGNCGNNEGLQYEIEYDPEVGHDVVYVKCPNCATCHLLDDNAEYIGITQQTLRQKPA